MLQKHPLVVDFHKEKNKALSSILPRESLRSSYQQGWQGIYCEYHCQPKHNTPEHYPQQHVIAINNIRDRTPLETVRTFDNNVQKEKIVNGDVVVVPAQIHHQVYWHRETEFTLLILEPRRIAIAAYEAIDPDLVEILPHFAKPDPLIAQIGLSLQSELETTKAIDSLYADSAANLLAVHLLRFYANKKPKFAEYADGLSKTSLQQVIEYIRANLDRDLSLEKLAELVQMSTFYFARLFKQSTGVTPHQYVIHCRLEQAKNLLISENASIIEICQKVGFQSQSHFTQLFRKYTGLTPKKYQETI
jgi:AraC family transcriptional regulator